ncbi:hypothetical protein PIB30_048439 [Stylosanthes scabra]|uniref:Uncharacterized protein n=1 Tax=Stylosanthes scabra TaxID=79078 RepID=A0ABU6VFG0_9FABA|nr:hypothetical protein [Stylosanthes scabra]
MLQKCLDLRSIGLPNFGLRICPEQYPKLLKLACWVCEFPQQDLSPECPKPSREKLGDLSKPCWRGTLEVTNSVALVMVRWRGVSEVRKSEFTSKALRERHEPLISSLRILLSEL